MTNPDPAEVARTIERASALRHYAAVAEARGDIGDPMGGGPTVWDWLRECALVEQVHGSPAAAETTLLPFRQVLATFRRNAAFYGGGTGEAFGHAAALLDTAIQQVATATPSPTNPTGGTQ